MKIRYSRRSLQQLDRLYSFVAAESPASAIAINLSIDAAIENLKRFPRIGRKTNEEAVRVIIEAKYRHRIFYTVRAREIFYRPHPAQSPGIDRGAVVVSMTG